MCTIFSYKTEDKKMIIGRNFDWIQRGGRIHIQPPSRSYGVRTNGLIFIEQMGEDMPYDGMNDKGLFVGMASVINSEIKNRFKDMNSLGLIKYILERASTAEEALYLARKYDLDYMEDVGYPKVHYMFADKSGHVLIYEEDKIEKHVTLDIGDGEVITNFAYYNMLPCERNESVKKHFKNKIKDQMDAKVILEEVKQPELTVYSAVYNLVEGSLNLWLEQDFAQGHEFYVCEMKKGQRVVDFGELRFKVMMSKGQ